MPAAVLLFMLFSAVTSAAQEIPDVAEPKAAQVQQETAEQQVGEDVADGAPETFDPTEEVSEDYSIEFPVDI